MSKMQQESIDMYRKGNREDLVEKEVNTQQIIDAMLPQVREEEAFLLPPTELGSIERGG